MEPGEALIDAAVREVLEETGVPVMLEGILRVEHAPTPNGARVRVIFIGSPTGDTVPKDVADDESLRASWLTLAEIAGLQLRGTDLLPLLQTVARGRQVFPLDLIGRELSI